MIKLGAKVQDTVSGFTGIATARIEYMNGCVQYCLKPKVDKEGKIQDGQWFDDDQLVIVGVGLSAEKDNLGGPIPDMPSGNYAG